MIKEEEFPTGDSTYIYPDATSPVGVSIFTTSIAYRKVHLM
jgi:hypothetical protein